jgi:oligopeptide/dipeptide ABC transporter ATP-binding protein
MLKVEDLWVTFPIQDKTLYAVRGISFEVKVGQAVGIVGESGCGKSAAVQAINQLTRGKVSGKILFEGKEIDQPGQTIGMVFQDPMTALNPTMKIGHQIAEGMIYHRLVNRKEARAKAIELLKLVGISDPKLRVDQYPHQFSGGMRQRVLIAIAIACNPRLLIADEPTTALDVTIQAQILDLLQRMRRQLNMSLLLISHDFHVIASICEEVLVMYAGKIVERGSVREILHHPRHPYTRMLLQSLPRLNRPRSEPLLNIEGSPPNLLHLPKGCAFKERCPLATDQCLEEPKGLLACWRVPHD